MVSSAISFNLPETFYIVIRYSDNFTMIGDFPPPLFFTSPPYPLSSLRHGLNRVFIGWKGGVIKEGLTPLLNAPTIILNTLIRIMHNPL
jgi:hypothetical protein